MATLATQQVALNGVLPTYTAASGGGDEFTPDLHTFIHVKNSDGSSHSVTIALPRTAFGEPITAPTVAVPAGSERMIGPFDPEGFRGSDSLAAITYTAATGITIAVIRA